MSPASSDDLDLARQACGISQEDLWLRYFALGGMCRPLELEAIVHDALRTSAPDRDLVVLALNERFSELGRDRVIPYSDEPRHGTPEVMGATEAAVSGEDPEPDVLLSAGVDALALRHSSLLRRVAQIPEPPPSRDALTGALPRDAGQDALQQAVDQSHRTRQPLMLVFLDVDHLKRTNDSQGHAAGDVLLQSLGNALREGLRPHDVVVRYGGDEFVCALPHAGLVQATARLGQVSARLGAAVPGASVTAGFAALQQHESLEDVLRRADEDMYSKRRHRASGSLAEDHGAAGVDVEAAPVRSRLSSFLRVTSRRPRRS